MPAPDADGPRLTRVETPSDLEAVLAIDEDAFLNPWTRDMYQRELARPDTSHIWVASVGGEPAAYCAFWLVVDELHLHNVATRHRFRRQGLAARLVGHALEVGRAAGTRRAMLEVRASNAAARALYARLGFREVAVRQAYYRAPVEDALVLWRDPV